MKKIFTLAVAVLVFMPYVASADMAPNPLVDYLTNQSGGVNVNVAAQTTSSTGACSTLTARGLGGLVDCIIGMLDKVIILLMAGAVVYIIWGAFQMITSEEKRKSGRETIIYGVIGLFVMVSVWGLVNILTSTFNLRGTYITPVQIHP